MRVGDQVRLVVPENLRLDGAVGTIAELTEWGAHVRVRAAATGCFRALWTEMHLDGTESGGDVCHVCGGGRMVRTGTCRTCQDCGESGGCG